MARVTPSLVVAFIERMTPGIANWTVDESKRKNLSSSFALGLAGLVELVGQIPLELMPAEAERYTELVSSVAAIRTQVETWQSRGQTGDLRYRTELGDLHPVSLIYRALAGLPDALPSADTATLLFIKDPDFELSLRTDISAASSALRNSEWKAATVLAGSVIEALLYWELQQHPSGDFETRKMNKEALDKWHLPQYIDAARKFGCVKPDTITDAEKAKNYRDLIHVGRVARLSQECDRGTARIALGALDHVVRDLEKPGCARHTNH